MIDFVGLKNVWKKKKKPKKKCMLVLVFDSIPWCAISLVKGLISTAFRDSTDHFFFDFLDGFYYNVTAWNVKLWTNCWPRTTELNVHSKNLYPVDATVKSAPFALKPVILCVCTDIFDWEHHIRVEITKFTCVQVEARVNDFERWT